MFFRIDFIQNFIYYINFVDTPTKKFFVFPFYIHSIRIDNKYKIVLFIVHVNY
jgi:hypothetical protein